MDRWDEKCNHGRKNLSSLDSFKECSNIQKLERIIEFEMEPLDFRNFKNLSILKKQIWVSVDGDHNLIIKLAGHAAPEKQEKPQENDSEDLNFWYQKEVIKVIKWETCWMASD